MYSKKDKDNFLEVFKNTLGNIGAACRQAKISRPTFYKWLKSDKEFADAIEEIKEQRIDFAENQLLQLMRGIKEKTNSGEVYTRPPCKTSLIFFLKTQGKKRGYIEGNEVTFYTPDRPPVWWSNEPMEDDK
jgi:AcrR family transcriptional regulator